MNEEWKEIIGYEGVYEVSNKGLVKSLPREWVNGIGAIISHNGKILKQHTDKRGYKRVHLCVDGVRKKRLVHQLVAESFMNHRKCGFKLVIDHIDDNPSNNNVTNLQIVTTRFNTYKTKNKNASSQYRGVCFYKPLKNWQASIRFNGKSVNLGRYEKEEDARDAYLNFMKKNKLK